MRSKVSDGVRLALAMSVAVCGPTTLAYAQSAPAVPSAQNTASSGPTEEVVVFGRQRSAATEVMQERIEQEVVVDLLGAEQIGRVGDSTVSLALRRLPGVTLVSDQFIYVRGLGERYSSTTLNGAHVPSPDLTRNVIPLDLFPSEIVDSLSVSKGYSADMPASFGGGNVDIRTTAIPNEPIFNFQLGSGWNDGSSGRALTYRGGDDDWKGTDDGTRAMPREIGAAIREYRGNISPNGILAGLSRDGQPHSLEQARAINRELATTLNRDLDFREESTDPDYSAQIALGNSWRFGEQASWRFGAIALGDYGKQTRNRERVMRDINDPDDLSFRTRRSIDQVALTGSLNLGLEYGEEHRIQATGMYLRNTEDEASLTVGNDMNALRADGRQKRNYRIRYEERELELMQLRGSHTLGEDTLELFGLADAEWLDFAHDLNVTWFYSDATARTDIPNEVRISAEDVIDPTTGAVFSTAVNRGVSAAEYRFTELEDEVRSSGWSASLPFTFGTSKLTVTAGQEEYLKGRSYLQTQLHLGSSAVQLQGTPGQVFSDANILDPANRFEVRLNRGLGSESYLAAERVDAAFAKFDLELLERWRVAGGVRWEQFRQLTVPIDQHEYDPNVPKVRLPGSGSLLERLQSIVTDEEDFYPSLSLTYMTNDFWAERFQLRFGWSQTVARPDLREISSAIYIDPLTEARVEGNPDLVPSDITNIDLRAEWFFDSGDNFTVSLFYKELDKPIETVGRPGTDDDIAITFINGESAEVYGIEVEWLKSLEFLSGALGSWANNFFVAGNVTLSDSKIDVGDQPLNVTNLKRRMTQHSQYVANLQIGFDSPSRVHSASLIYNSFGKRVFFAGRDGGPDAYEQPFDSLDFVYSFFPTDRLTLKLRAQNLLDEKLEVTRRNVVALEQDVGITFKLDASIEF
jgi:TonB-dependent receptor